MIDPTLKGEFFINLKQKLRRPQLFDLVGVISSFSLGKVQPNDGKKNIHRNIKQPHRDAQETRQKEAASEEKTDCEGGNSVE